MSDNEELSLEQKNRLHGMAAIPFFVVFFVLTYYFLFYLVSYGIVVGTIWDFFIYFVLPLFLIGVPSSCLAFEILYHREIKQPLTLHVKRFSGRVLLIIPSGLSFCGLLALANIFLSPITGEKYAIIIGGLTWMLGFYVVLTKFKEFFSKLDRGEW